MMNKVSLALLAKIDQLYKSLSDVDNSFISYTALPTTYTSNQFVFPGHENNNIDALQTVHNQWEFTHLIDVIPKVKLLWDPKVEPIWQVYKEVIDNALIAEKRLTPAQEQALEEANNIIKTFGENYSKYQNLYFTKQFEINNLRMESDNADTPEERKREIIDILNFKRNELKTIDQNWIILGKKEKYENAVATISSLERNFISKWKFDLNSKLKEHNMLNDALTNDNFYPTYCLPSDFYKEKGPGWSEISLNKSEVDSLYNYAKNELLKDYQEVLSNQYSELEIEKLTAKIAFITITRNWFDPRFLESNLWKLPDYLQPLSDGGNPPRGELPAFVDKIIFIKDVDIELKQNSQINSKTIKEHQKNNIPIMTGPLLLKIPVQTSPKTIQKLEMQKKYNAVNSLKFTKFVGSYNKRVIQNPKLVKTMQKNVSVSAVTTLNAPPVHLNAAMAVTKTAIPQARFVAAPQIATVSAIKMQPVNITRINPNIVGIQSRKYGFKGIVRTDGPLNEIISITFIHGKNKNIRRVTKTDINGKYSINLLPAPYYIEIKQPGFERYFKLIKYTKKQGFVPLNITLKRTAAPGQSPDAVEQEIEGSYNGYVLVGFVCKKFAKCPNPDKSVDEWI